MCGSPNGPMRSTPCASPPAALDLLLGCDLVVSASAETLSQAAHPGHSRAIVNSHETITGDFTRNPDLPFPGRDLRRSIAAAVGADNAAFVEATRAGDRSARRFDRHQSVHARLCLSARTGAGIGGGDRARHRTQWRRRSHSTAAPSLGPARRARPRARSRRARSPADAVPASHRLSQSLDEGDRTARRVPRRVPERRLRRALYFDRIGRVRGAEARAHRPAARALTDAAARALVQGDGLQGRIRGRPALQPTAISCSGSPTQFEGEYELRFHLAPPLVAERDPATGHLRKRDYGPLDARRVPPPGATALPARHAVRPLRAYRRTPRRAAPRSPNTRRCSTRSSRRCRAAEPRGRRRAGAALPLEIRGFGHVKEANLDRAKAKEADLLGRFRSPPAPPALEAAE